MNEKIKVLFVCIHNSARSQMGEAWLEILGEEGYEVYSAGLEKGHLNPIVVEVMAEKGIDISKKESNTVDEYLNAEIIFNYVITVCDGANGERCPIFPGEGTRLHWGFEDPSALSGSKKDKLASTRIIRDQIKKRVDKFLITGK